MASATASSSVDVDKKDKKKTKKSTPEERTILKIIRQVVPWETPEKFRKVHTYLYSNEVEKKRWAVDEISVWESRCESLPTAIEASSLITRAVIQDILTSNRVFLSQEHDVQQMYACALVRFVNLVVEVHQTDSKQSTALIAKGLGIPSWIVDLRNEASHSILPSLSALRMGADAAMKYLDEEYWSIEVSKPLKMIKNEPFNYGDIHKLLYLYRTRQYYIITCLEDTEEVAREMEDMRKILKDLKKQICSNKKKLIEALLHDGVFIPFEEELKGLLTHEEQRAFNYKEQESYLRALSRFEKADDDDDDDDEEEVMKSHTLPDVPVILQKLWCPLLRIMNKYHAVPEFIESLLFTQQDRYPVGQKILLSWVNQILLLHPESSNAKKDGIREVFTGGNAMFNWDRLLYAAVASPCKYIVLILPLIVGHLNDKEEAVKSIMRLVAIRIGYADSSGGQQSSEDHRIFNVQDLKRAKQLQEMKKKKKRKAADVENLFEECIDLPDLKYIPIGHDFGAQEDDSEESTSVVTEPEETKTKEYTEKSLFCSENGEEEDAEVVVTSDSDSEDDMDVLREMGSILYRKKS